MLSSGLPALLLILALALFLIALYIFAEVVANHIAFRRAERRRPQQREWPIAGTPRNERTR